MIKIKHLKESTYIYNTQQFIDKIEKYEKKLNAHRFSSDHEHKFSCDYILKAYDESKDNDLSIEERNRKKKEIDYYVDDWNDYIKKISQKLLHYKVDMKRIHEQSLLEDWLSDMFSGDDERHNTVRIYAKDEKEDIGLGWILYFNNGKIEYFEGTEEELSENDKYLLDAFTPAKLITLYSTQDYEFVQSWKEKGIPKNVFFATTKQFALHHWHTTGNDVLIQIEIWNKELQRTDEETYMTIDLIKPDKFKLKVIG